MVIVAAIRDFGSTLTGQLLKRLRWTMPGGLRIWNGKDWEKHIQLLLKKRYVSPPGSYQEIRDTVKGDAGVEGFATDGSAYQCYVAQEWATAEQLLKKQQNKITIDIGKFIRNETVLCKLFGNIRITQWNLVVPYWSDKSLKVHANKKAFEVEKLKLKHAGKNFRISVLTADDFASEVQLLAKIDLHKFDAAAPSIPPVTLSEWMAGKQNLEVVSNLTRKALLIGAEKSVAARQKFEARIVSQYIGGNIVLSQLQQELPETHSRVLEYKVSREENLEAESFTTPKVPAEFFEATLHDYKEELMAIPGISVRAAGILAREAVADWLLRCPMDFD